MNYIFETMLSGSSLAIYALFCAFSFFLCLIIIFSKISFVESRLGQDEIAVQSAHKGSVKRTGGLAIYLGLLFVFILTFYADLGLQNLSWLILSAAPVFLIGLAEDFGYRISPFKRIIGSLISGIIVILIYGVWVDRLEIPGIDFLMSFAIIGILFTLFATVGVSNSFNLIDGLNGLSSFAIVSTALCLSIVAIEVDLVEISTFLFFLISVTLGFMILNFPLGKIFLGDAGAYACGHMLVWSAIILVNLDLTVSPFAILLIFFWPVADTCLAIWRRWKLGIPTDKPDKLHFHQLTMRFIEIKIFGRRGRNIANPLATITLIPFISFPQFMGVAYFDSIYVTITVTMIMTILFFLTYLIILHWAKSNLKSI